MCIRDRSKANKKPEQQNGKGDDSNQAQSQNPKADQKAQQKKSDDGSQDGVGERSGLPDRNAKTEEGELGDQPSGDGLGPNKKFKESSIESQDEKFDSRYTGGGSSLDKNDVPAQSKTSIDDVTLAKPRGSKELGEQPIPLEYRDILN